MRSQSSRAVLLLLVALAAAMPAAGRSACELQLETAEASLRSGQFDEALGLARECLQGSPSRREKARAYALLARTHLAADETPQAREAVASLLRADPDFEPDLFDAPRFARLVEEVRLTAGAVQVTSVSKTPESLREAPATVMVVTAEEIERRGYLHLEEVLHDLPGFHISRGNGNVYSNIYQRGYLSNSTERTLFLVDGIEQNDLTSNVAILSRQYPLSNVDRVEVVYGPASTMYGANAYLGVINVILKEPESLLAKGARIGSSVHLGGGSFETRSFDGMVAGRTQDGSVSWSLTGRTFNSREHDLSGFPEWDYETSDESYRTTLRLEGKAMEEFLAKHGSNASASELYEVVLREDVSGLEPTAKGIQLARERDRIMAQKVGGKPVGFSDVTDDRWLSATVKMTNLKLDFQSWTQREGTTSWYHELSQPGADNGALWSPRQMALSAKYSRSLQENLSLHFFSRYKVHELAPDSTIFSLRSYASGGLKLGDLVDGKTAGWQRTNLYRSSSQLQNELSFAWEPLDKLSVVGGVELRHGSIQGDYTQAKDEIGAPPAVAAEAGQDPSLPGGNRFSVKDLGIYLQASYRLREDLKVVAGGRLDDNQVRENGGYGTVFNPRLAVVWSPGPAVVKAIYSEAFKDASNFNRYATVPGTRELANPGLEPEKARSYELSASWQRGPLTAGAAVYQADYSGVVGLGTAPYGNGVTGQFQNLGSARIRGFEANASLRWRRLDLFANYTFADPHSIEPKEERFGGIASHQANLGAHAPVGRLFEADLRVNVVGDRPIGKGTTTFTERAGISEVAGYAAVHTALTYKHARSGARLQLVVNNLFDSRYYDPGVRQPADQYAVRVPQPGRAAYLRLLFKR
jgi:outer membrane receptor for ferrienterochelin and colicins